MNSYPAKESRLEWVVAAATVIAAIASVYGVLKGNKDPESLLIWRILVGVTVALCVIVLTQQAARRICLWTRERRVQLAARRHMSGFAELIRCVGRDLFESTESLVVLLNNGLATEAGPAVSCPQLLKPANVAYDVLRIVAERAKLGEHSRLSVVEIETLVKLVDACVGSVSGIYHQDWLQFLRGSWARFTSESKNKLTRARELYLSITSDLNRWRSTLTDVCGPMEYRGPDPIVTM